MKIKKKTVLNILVMALILSFFVTPLGHYSKRFLIGLFAFSPTVIQKQDRKQLADYEWRLKDENWDYFQFEKSKGKVVFINFWASWRLPCEAELASIQKLYDKYNKQVDFYLITNEERPPVEAFMEKRGFDFPVTYLIIGDKAPIVPPEKVPFTYIIDKEGYIAIAKEDIADWDSAVVTDLLDTLIADE